MGGGGGGGRGGAATRWTGLEDEQREGQIQWKQDSTAAWM